MSLPNEKASNLTAHSEKPLTIFPNREDGSTWSNTFYGFFPTLNRNYPGYAALTGIAREGPEDKSQREKAEKTQDKE